MYLPSGKLEAKKSCSNFSKASLKIGFKGSIAEGLLGLSSCWPFSLSRPSTVVDLFVCLFIWSFTSLLTLYRSYHDG